LASWLEQRQPDSWWTVDGDSLLTELLPFPCPSDVIAIALKSVGKPLLLLPPEDVTVGTGAVSLDDLDALADTDSAGNRIFRLSWAETVPPVDWLLVEDKGIQETSSSSAEGEV